MAFRSSAESLPSLSLSYFSVISLRSAFCSSVSGGLLGASGFFSLSAALAARASPLLKQTASINARTISNLFFRFCFLFVTDVFHRRRGRRGGYSKVARAITRQEATRFPGQSGRHLHRRRRPRKLE